MCCKLLGLVMRDATAASASGSSQLSQEQLPTKSCQGPQASVQPWCMIGWFVDDCMASASHLQVMGMHAVLCIPHGAHKTWCGRPRSVMATAGAGSRVQSVHLTGSPKLLRQEGDLPAPLHIEHPQKAKSVSLSNLKKWTHISYTEHDHKGGSVPSIQGRPARGGHLSVELLWQQVLC